MPSVPPYRNPAQFKKQKQNSSLPTGAIIGGLLGILLLGGGGAAAWFLFRSAPEKQRAEVANEVASTAESNTAESNTAESTTPFKDEPAAAANASAAPPKNLGSDHAASSSGKPSPFEKPGTAEQLRAQVNAASKGGLGPLPAQLKSAGMQRLSDSASASLQYRLQPNVDYGVSFSVELITPTGPQVTKGRTVYRLVDENPQTLLNSNAGALEEDYEAGNSTGTGFAIHPDGLLVTCAHVVEDAHQLSVVINGRDIPGQVVAIDSQNDLALVRIEYEFKQIIGLNDELPELGVTCRAIGFPLAGDMLGEKVKMSTGTIVGDDIRMNERRLQIDATVNPGNSGGPVVGDHGELFGVADSIMVMEQTQDVSFAVPVDVVARMLQRARAPYATSHFGKDVNDPRVVKTYKDATNCAFLIRVNNKAKGPEPKDLMVLSFDCAMDGNGSKQSLQQGRVVIDRSGRVYFSSNSPSLPMFLNRAGTIGFDRYPDGPQTSWKSIDASMVSVNIPNRGNQADDNPFGMLGTDVFSPGFRRPGGGLPVPPSRPPGPASEVPQEMLVMKIQACKLEGDRDSTTEFALIGADPLQSAPQLVVNGKGKSTLDPQSGFAKMATMSGDFTSALGGRSQRGRLRMTYGYMTEAEMKAEEAAEAARQRELEAKAKAEAEARRIAAEKAEAERLKKLSEEVKRRDTKLTKSLDQFDPDK
ncbi:MAG: S1C family serine protease [Planctomycetota bacterium]